MTEEDRVTGAWRRIEAWLKSNAPETASFLQPGAGADQIAQAEAEMASSLRAAAAFHRTRNPEGAARLAERVTIPGPLATWWRLVNGTGPELEWDDPEESLVPRAWLPGWQTFISVQGAAALHARNVDVLIEHQDHTGRWVPFAMFDPDGITGLFMDSTPRAGTFGHVADWSLEDWFTADGVPLPAWLESIAAALEEGQGLDLGDGIADRHMWPCLRAGSLRWLDLVSDATELASEGWQPVNDPR
ncbi:SMI1/KNR4 family protein [Streptomyces pristinaespiralis]|nr:hypothetical protein [Streptomyces pristinaespiralis]